MRASARHLLSALVLASVSPVVAHAQMPGAPIFQNAFSNPGLTVAGNYASGDGTTLGAAAVAYAPGTGRFQFSGGVGRLMIDEVDGSVTPWGARLGVPLFSFATGRGGIAPFIGLGGASRDSVRLLQVPAGVGAGWRMGLGATRAMSLYATGTYLWARTTVGDTTQSNGLVRLSVAADVTVIRKLGLTLGYEMGANAKAGESGPAGSIFGAGLSWAFR